MALDLPEPTFRHVLYPAYKGSRPTMPEDLLCQMPYVPLMAEALYVTPVAHAGYEADDVIGALSKQAESKGWSVVIVASDKDMAQLVSPQISLYDPIKDQYSTEADIQARWGVAPSQMVDLLSLMGDKIDGVPGVKGIGKKIAGQLIAQFGTLDHLLMHLDEVASPVVREALRASAETVRCSRLLIALDVDCPVTFEPEQFACRPADHARLIPLCQELELSRLLRRLTDWASAPSLFPSL